MEQMPLGLKFAILGRSFKKQMDELLRERELTGVQFGVLGELLRLEHSGSGQISQRDLESASHVTHPTMTEILKRLEKKGFVLCRPGENDRRCKCVSSTEKTLGLGEELAEADRRVVTALTAGMSEEDVAQLIRLTDIMLKNSCKGRENNVETTGRKRPGI